jgi:hypothetical protein
MGTQKKANAPADMTTHSAPRDGPNTSSVWKDLPMPFPPQIPKIRGTRVCASNAPWSANTFLATCRATASMKAGAT